MFKRIIVPLDGSAQAERAFHVAARIAHATDGTVVLVRVVATPRDRYPLQLSTLPSAAMQSMLEVERAAAHAYLREVANSMPFAALPCEQEVRIGPPAATILDVADTSRADLIVLCRHGESHLTRWTLGSVAEKVLHETTLPVVLLGNDLDSPHSMPQPQLHTFRVLIPVDGSLQAERAIEPAAVLAAALTNDGQAVVSLVHVVNLPPIDYGYAQHGENEERKYILHAAQAYLSELVTRLSKGPLMHLPLTFAWSFLFGEDATEALLSVTEQHAYDEYMDNENIFEGYDLLAMATHGRGGRHQMIGSVTERMLRMTRLPLLLIHPAENVSALSGMFANRAVGNVQMPASTSVSIHSTTY